MIATCEVEGARATPTEPNLFLYLSYSSRKVTIGTTLIARRSG